MMRALQLGSLSSCSISVATEGQRHGGGDELPVMPAAIQALADGSYALNSITPKKDNDVVLSRGSERHTVR